MSDYRLAECGLFETMNGDDVDGVLLVGSPISVREAGALLNERVEISPTGTLARLTAERDEARRERDRVAAEWAEVSQGNYQRAKAAEAARDAALAEVERLREALATLKHAVVTSYYPEGYSKWIVDALAGAGAALGEKGGNDE